jgi:HK97 family phage prohead protease
MNKRHTLNLNVKAVDTARGTFSGLGSVFGNEDLTGDVVERGAFTKTLHIAEQVKSATGSPVLWPLLWMHDEKNPVGAVMAARETADGLAIDCQCDMDTEAGRDAFSRIKNGYATGLSIGYTTVKATRDAKGVRHLLEVKLFEISVVTTGFAANPLAQADLLSVKSVREPSMNPKDWYSPRVPFGPYVHPESAETRVPRPEDFRDERKYQEAYREWCFKSFLNQKAEEPTRVVDKGGAKEHEVGYLHSTHSMADVDAELAAQRAQRVASGTATLAERIAHYNATGHTPDGRTLPDTDEAFNRAYDAIYKLLAAARKGR